jgi:hypothetical protein
MQPFLDPGFRRGDLLDISISACQAISVARGMRFILLFISLLAQRNEPKKGPPVPLVPPLAGYPALLNAAGSLQTRCAQTVQTPFSAASPVLGGVSMGFHGSTGSP